jgi:hypothetical protein
MASGQAQGGPACGERQSVEPRDRLSAYAVLCERGWLLGLRVATGGP